MDRDWGRVGDVVCQILYQAYVDKRRWFGKEARARGISRESLVAAAICGMIETWLEGEDSDDDVSRN
jgi:hypothetical protein